MERKGSAWSSGGNWRDDEPPRCGGQGGQPVEQRKGPGGEARAERHPSAEEQGGPKGGQQQSGDLQRAPKASQKGQGQQQAGHEPDCPRKTAWPREVGPGDQRAAQREGEEKRREQDGGDGEKRPGRGLREPDEKEPEADRRRSRLERGGAGDALCCVHFRSLQFLPLSFNPPDRALERFSAGTRTRVH